MLSKSEQLKKTKRVKLNRLSKIENKLFHDTILDITLGVCQLCEEREGDDYHHCRWGCYGASKDDTCQALVCRKCHEICHSSKHGLYNQRAEKIGDANWKEHTNG